MFQKSVLHKDNFLSEMQAFQVADMAETPSTYHAYNLNLMPHTTYYSPIQPHHRNKVCVSDYGLIHWTSVDPLDI